VSALLLTREPLDVASALAAVAGPAHGATAVFTGSTREDDAGPHAIVALFYDAYPEMAFGILEALADDVAARFGAVLSVHHRLGEVPVGETALVVAAGAPHRAEAFAACRYAMERITHEVPIWKQDVRADGTREWRDGMAAIGSAR